jgi:hypothetical protein
VTDSYTELRDLDRETYVAAINIAAGVIHNITYSQKDKANPDLAIEKAMVAIALKAYMRGMEHND